MAESDVLVRTDEGNDKPARLSWDTEFNLATNRADWVVADETEDVTNRGGFKSQNPLGTAIYLCLFSNARLPDDMNPTDGSNERQGWHGNSYNVDRALGERALGSLLWNLSRRALNNQTEMLAKHYAAVALQTLIDQGAVNHFEIETEVDKAKGRMNMLVRAIDTGGQSLFIGQVGDVTGLRTWLPSFIGAFPLQ